MNGKFGLSILNVSEEIGNSFKRLYVSDNNSARVPVINVIDDNIEIYYKLC